jgi:conjugative transposon protein TcpC
VIGRTIRKRLGPSPAARRPSTPAELLARCRQVVLWLTIGLLLLRGANDVLATKPASRQPGVERTGEEPVWPDDAARAFAVDFASEYLSLAPDEPHEYARRVGEFASAELASELTPRAAARASAQVVQSATVADVELLHEGHALITVAARVAGAGSRRLTVPVARDRSGGLVVYDLPSFTAPSAHGRVSRPPSQPLIGSDREQIEDVLGRFFRAYLSGAADELAYLIPPGARIGAAAGDLELVSLGSIAEPIPAERSGDRRLVLVTPQARDARSRAVHALRYRVQLVRRDRWYVAAVNGAEQRGGR